MLTILLGPAKCGKSRWILDDMIRQARQGRQGQLLLTPEQFSHQMERRLAQAGGPTVCRYAEVLSFSRLATRVFSHEGGLCRQSLDAGGRLLAMAQALESVRSRLRLYGAASGKPAFYTQLLTATDELKSYAVSSARLREAAGQTQGALAVKLEELALILDSYDAVCANGQADPRDTLSRLADQLSGSTWAEGRAIYVDGFTDFTTLELQVLEALLKRCGQFTVALACDGPESGTAIYDSARRTAAILKRMADRYQIEVEWIQLSPPVHRKPAMQYLNRALFAPGTAPFSGETPEIVLSEAASIRDECQTAVKQILDLAEQGTRYRDMAVAVTDQSRYGPILESLCAQYGVPLYLSGKKNILQKPVMTYLTAALEAASGNLEPEDVLRYLKTGLSPVDRDTCDLLENYIVVWNLRGSRWASAFTAHPDGYGLELDTQAEAVLEKLNAGREAGIVPLLELQAALQAAKNTGELVLAFYDFITRTGLEERLEALAQQLLQKNRRQEAMEHLQLYSVVVSALEQFYAVLGQTAMRPQEFCRMFMLQLSQYDVGTIPVTLDAVLCGTIPDLRNQSPKYLLVLGAGDGVFPSGVTPSGLLSEEDRQQLELCGIQLAPGLEGRLNQELAGILSVLSSPEEGLSVSYSAEDGAPAYLYQRLCALFPGAVREQESWSLALYRPEPAAALLAQYGAEPRWAQLQVLCAGLPQVAELAGGLRRQAAREPGALSAELVRQLWGMPIFLSASRLESYAACHHAFFLRYGLKAKNHVRAAFDAPVFGTFVHYVLEHTARQVRDEGGFAELSEERLFAIADSYIQKYTEEEMHGLAGQSERFVYLYRRNLAEVRRVVDSMAAELRVSDFQPEAFELGFAPGADVPPYRVTSDHAAGEISGFVDRVDLYSHDGVRYVRVVDYKTGKKVFDYTDVYQGLSLQMLIYLFALERSDKRFGKLTPAGVLYVPARSAVLSSPSRLTPETAEKSRKKELRRHGILTDDELVLSAMEHCDGSPTYLPYTVKKDGTRTGDLMNREQMQLLRRHVDRRLRELLEQMAAGEVSPNPYFKGPSVSACQWCDYKLGCQPEAGCRRYFAKRTYQDFWEALQEWEARHG